MTPRLVLFLLWIAMVMAGCLSASYYAWSPFSDEERPMHAGGSYGPTHK